MIGILDWGIGGLSVYRALRQRGRSTDVVYFSDSGSIPYGKLSREALRARLTEIAGFFRQQEISRVLVACHAASSALAPDPASGSEELDSVAFSSIIPAACHAVEQSPARRVAVIGGNVTISSQVYVRALAGLGRQLEFQSAQPLSAFVEAGELDSPAVKAEVKRLLAGFHAPEALLLACTHYPALAPLFQEAAPELQLLDPAADMVATIAESGSGRLRFHTTGDRTASIVAARLAFGVDLEIPGTAPA